MMPMKYRVGQSFSRLTIVEILRFTKNCICDCVCGTKGHKVRRSHLGKSVSSCGCLLKEIARKAKTHGETLGKEYPCWRAMIDRCENKNHDAYYRYGGRGISIFPAWRHDFSRFLADVGRRPSLDHSLDRWPNNNGNYEPGNVRWATRKEQCRHRRSSRIVSAFGKSMTVVEWSEVTGLLEVTILRRLRAGKSHEESLSLSDGRSSGGRLAVFMKHKFGDDYERT